MIIPQKNTRVELPLNQLPYQMPPNLFEMTSAFLRPPKRGLEKDGQVQGINELEIFQTGFSESSYSLNWSNSKDS